MELQFEKQEIACLVQAARAVKEQEVTQEIRLTQSMPDVGRVLAGWGQVVLRGKEWQGSRIAVSGGVMAWVLYAPEDGTEPRVVDAWIPFQMKWDANDAEREGPMRMMPLLRFVDGRNLSARKILVRAGVACLGEGLYRKRAEIFSPPEMPEDVELLRRSYPVRLLKEAGEKAFTLEETLEVGSHPVQEILSYTLQPEVNENRLSGDKVILRGMGRLHLVYRCREGRIRTKDFEIPFSQLGELENTYQPDASADVMMAVTGLELDMAEEKLALKCSLVAQYLVTARTMLELVTDAYSPRREVGIRQEELHLPMILDETRERLNAQGNFPDVTMDVVDGVFWPGFPQTGRNGDRAELEIPGRFQLIGYAPDGTVRSAVSRWEGKTTLGADETSRIDAVTIPMGETQWSQTGNGLEARGEAEVRTITQSRRGLPMITGLEFGEVRELGQRPTLILCRPGGRGLWDLARDSGSSVSAIREANGLEDDPEDNRMLLIPIQS